MDLPRIDPMPRNSTTMIQTARQEFDQILDSLRAQAEAESTAYQVERDLFARLLALGRLLLEVFFAHCARRSAQQGVASKDGVASKAGRRLRLHSWKPRRYVSVFGPVQIERPYFWAKGRGGHVPMDEALSLPEDTYSDLLREQVDLLSAQMAYGKTAAVIERLLGISLSTGALTRLVERDAGEVTAFYHEQPLPESHAPPESHERPREEAPVLVAEADGKGVPMRPALEGSGSNEGSGSTSRGDPSPVRLGKGQKRTKKKEAVVTSLYTTGRRPRSAEEVLDSFFSPPGASSTGASSTGASSTGASSTGASSTGASAKSRSHREKDHREDSQTEESHREGPQNKKVWATLEGKSVAFERLADQVRHRDGPHVTDRVALSDGCRALQDRFREHFPRFELVLDFVHVSEYLWNAANVLFEETGEERLDWVIERSRELLTGRHEEVLARLRQASTCSGEACAREACARDVCARDVCARVARYFERNAERMDYARYLARGWPIATGVIEGACRHLVKDRCESSGMRWCPDGAEQVLGLRSVWTNGDWDAYHRHRRQKRHRQLYGGPLEETDSLEEQMWRMAA